MNRGHRLPDTPEPQRNFEGADGIMIAADSWGDPSDPPVILSHGAGQTRHSWRGMGEALARLGYFAIAIDLRGHSDSGWAAKDNYGWDPMIADLAAIAREIENGHQPILIGASMGGSVSLLAAGEGKVSPQALVLVDIAPVVNKEGSKRIHGFMRQRPDGFRSLEEAAEAISDYQPHRKRAPNPKGLAKNLRMGEDGRFHWHWDPNVLNIRRDPEKRQARMEASARALTIPVLLVRGEKSDVLTDEGAQLFLGLCPTAEYVSLVGAHHMVAGDRNDRFGAAAMDFLKRHGVHRTEP